MNDAIGEGSCLLPCGRACFEVPQAGMGFPSTAALLMAAVSLLFLWAWGCFNPSCILSFLKARHWHGGRCPICSHSVGCVPGSALKQRWMFWICWITCVHMRGKVILWLFSLAGYIASSAGGGCRADDNASARETFLTQRAQWSIK